MSDDAYLEEVLQEHGVSREEFERGKRARKELEFNRTRLMEAGGIVMGKARNYAEQEIEDIEKVRLCDFNCVCRLNVILPMANFPQEVEEKKEKAKKAEEENIEGWLRVLHQGKGQEITLKVMVDTGATVNAITYGMVIDYQLEGRKTRLKEPQVLGLAVGTFECKEQITINWMGKGNEEHDTSTFYVLPRGQANITDRVILSREWLNKRCLLYDKDPSHYLKPLLGGRQSVCTRFESQSVLASMSHSLIVLITNRNLRKLQGHRHANRP